ncbi:MAG TPA: sulfatase-like hydrolase/transferase [Rhodanobacter sp.]|jgi:phosphoglycerol transferase MdoB-like AlkP superfamily enzyme|nr:sulfatase-like hydrolase/transferase [Rhodanobacter sp.]
MQAVSLRFLRPYIVLGAALVFFLVCVALAAGSEPQRLQQLFIASLMLCTLGALLAALARPATALVLAGGMFLGLRFIAVLKMQYLESTLLPADFVYFARTSLVDTLRHYPHLYALGIGLCVLGPVLLYLVWRGDLRWRGRSRWRAGLLRVLGVAGFAAMFWMLLLPHGAFAQVHARAAWDEMSDDALLTDFFVNWRDSEVQLPRMSSALAARQQWSGTVVPPAPATHGPYPDIVQVLEESTFDPANFDACHDVALCQFALFRPDARTRGAGVLRVHTFGGGTWVSEFAALTGMPHDIFGPGGMYAPFVLAPHMRDALPWLLRRLGYTTIAVYPTVGSFLNGRNAYRAYGFDHLYDANELQLDEWEESDAQMFAAAARAYALAKRPGHPVFMMVLTVNQHGPHDDAERPKLPEPWRHGVARGLAPAAALNFDTYLWRLHDSDLAMRGLEHTFLDRPQPTILLHFGDHQPSFAGLLRGLPRTLTPGLRPYRDELTYYVLKSNFPGPALPHYPMLDIAFLPTMVLQAAGLPADAYFAAATTLRDRCGGRFDDCPVPGLLASYEAWVFEHLRVYQ